MSNFLAIATTTVTLLNMLQSALIQDTPSLNTRVTTMRPDDLRDVTEPRVNIYLYQVTPNAAWRNADLPTRRADGSMIQRPQVALDLHYLLSFYGNETYLEPQRLLGVVARTLHAQPVLTHEMIINSIDALRKTDHGFDFLQSSNLADEVELVRFSPLHLSLEELSKIWSVFFQVQYALSVAYQGTVILIEGNEMLQRPLPVRERNVYASPFNQPSIDQVTVQQDPTQPPLPDQPILANSILWLTGHRLRGDRTLVRVAGSDPLVPESVSDKRIVLDLSKVAGLQAGVQGVQVIHQLVIGSPPVPHPGGVESNVAPFVLSPAIQKKADGDYDITLANVQGADNAPRSADITLKVTPAIGKRQRVVLLLNEISPVPGQALDHTAHAYSFDAPPLTEETTESITFSIKGIRAGTYLVRIQVDGAESPLDIDTKYLQGGTDPKTRNLRNPTFNTFTGKPQVTIP